ncbi:MAG: glycosyltransferase [Alphaproteobacteria bacterium]|nr:glycosyltransferase [Alphaproteobacteria bacterium]
MSAEQQHTSVKNPKRIYFMLPVYLVGGGETYVCRMMEYLIAYTDVKIGIIDFKDGMLSRTCKKFFPDEDIHYVDYEKNDWHLDDDSVIFAGADHLGCVKNIEGKNIRIQINVWESVFGWDILFEPRTKRAVAKLLKETNGAAFIDIGCYSAACKQLKQKFKELYMPLFFHTPEYAFYPKETPENEINLVWLGRFAGSKELSIYNIIENFAAYKTDKKKVFHLIGNGPLEDKIKNYAKKYEQEIRFIFPGVLTGEELPKYLQKNADAGVAMGTSMLNIGSLGIPCIAAAQSDAPITITKFLWLSDMYGGCAGTPLEDNEIFRPMYDKLKTFDQMLDDISKNGKRNEIGEQCRRFYLETYGSLENCGKTFLDCINQTTLSYESLKKTLRFLPYNDVNGLAVNTIRVLGIPVIKIKNHGNKTRCYLFGIKTIKIVHSPGKKKIYLFGIKLFDFIKWGRYAYDEATNPKVKKECKNKYAISERIVKQGK